MGKRRGGGGGQSWKAALVLVAERQRAPSKDLLSHHATGETVGGCGNPNEVQREEAFSLGDSPQESCWGTLPPFFLQLCGGGGAPIISATL